MGLLELEITAKMLLKPSQGNSLGSHQSFVALLIRKFLASFTGKLFSNCNQTPTANLLKAACNLWVRSNETSSDLACFILLQLGNILSNGEGHNLCTERAKGFRKLRAANNSLKSPAFHDEAELCNIYI